METKVYYVAVPCLALCPKAGRKGNDEISVVVVGRAVEAEHGIEVSVAQDDEVENEVKVVIDPSVEVLHLKDGDVSTRNTAVVTGS